MNRMKLKAKAKLMFDSLELAKRQSGEEFYKLKEGSPGWMTDVIRVAHNGMLPDDYKYRFVHEALDAIVNAEQLEEIDLEADIYTHELLKWMASNITRTEYADEAMEERGQFKSFVDMLMAAQSIEKNHTLNRVIHELEKLEGKNE